MNIQIVAQKNLLLSMLLLSLVLLSSCATERPPLDVPASVPTLLPTATPITTPNSDWHQLASGIELRRLEARVLPVQVVRIEPTQVRFVVGYDPTAPRALSAWAAQYGAIAAINGGFFDQRGEPVALLISDQRAIGESYVNQGGMFAVDDNGVPHLWSLAEQPYDGAGFTQAIQGWPLLVRTEGQAAYTSEDGQRARRSAIALDREGRVLLIVAPAASFSLAEWSAFLAATDLGITVAVNLDGGSSSGLIAQGAQGGVRIDPFVPLPFALLVLPL